MQATRALLHRQPMIRFVGRRTIPHNIDHAARPHPESPSTTLPESFASYREKATQHGPLKTQPPSSSSSSSASPAAPSSTSAAASAPHGLIGGHSAKELGPIKVNAGEFWALNQLPARFHRAPMSQAEIDAIETGGASLFA